jgi:hypothetical protein
VKEPRGNLWYWGVACGFVTAYVPNSLVGVLHVRSSKNNLPFITVRGSVGLQNKFTDILFITVHT